MRFRFMLLIAALFMVRFAYSWQINWEITGPYVLEGDGQAKVHTVGIRFFDAERPDKTLPAEFQFSYSNINFECLNNSGNTPETSKIFPAAGKFKINRENNTLILPVSFAGNSQPGPNLRFILKNQAFAWGGPCPKNLDAIRSLEKLVELVVLDDDSTANARALNLECHSEDSERWENVIDQNPTTQLQLTTANSDQLLQQNFDIVENRQALVKKIRILVLQNNTPSGKTTGIPIELYTSDNGVNWQPVYAGYCGQEKNQWTEIEFTTPVLCRNIQLKLGRIRQNIALAEMQVIGTYSTDVDDTILAQKPIEFELFQNYPNPFNPTTTIRFDLPEKAMVNLSVYNLVGQQIRGLSHEYWPAGRHSLIWDGTNKSGELVSSGIYFCRIQVDTNTRKHQSTRRMILIK